MAGLAALLVPIPFAFYRWGKLIRLRSPMLLQLQRDRERA